MERIADVMDRASVEELADTERAVSNAMLKSASESYVDDMGRKLTQGKDAKGKWVIPDCVGCDLKIPKVRLELGKVRCVDCQTALEKKLRKF